MSASAPRIAPRIALVTGAGSGVGRQVALALLADGYAVALAGRRRAPLEETATLSGAPDRAMPFEVDVADPDGVTALYAAIGQRFGRLDLLFNNAGIGSPPVPFDEIPLADWMRVVGTNLNGAFLCAQGAFRMMRHQDPQGGRIINNGSISAHVPRPNSAPYTATKHAITGLTRSLSLDGRGYDIACGQIDIGNALTPMAARMPSGVPQADGSIKPEPLMDADNVARSVLLMAGMPLDANVQFLTVMATKMPFIGRG